MIFPKSKLIAEIEDRIEYRRKTLSCGVANNMKEYGEACGYVQGLDAAIDIFEDVWEEYKKQIQAEEAE